MSGPSRPKRKTVRRKKPEQPREHVYYFGNVCPICSSDLKGIMVAIRTWETKR